MRKILPSGEMKLRSWWKLLLKKSFKSEKPDISDKQKNENVELINQLIEGITKDDLKGSNNDELFESFKSIIVTQGEKEANVKFDVFKDLVNRFIRDIEIIKIKG